MFLRRVAEPEPVAALDEAASSDTPRQRPGPRTSRSSERRIKELNVAKQSNRGDVSAANISRRGIEHTGPKSAARPGAAIDKNVRAISEWEQAALHARSGAERLSDWITATTASGPVLIAHVIWFAAWTIVNVGAVGAWKPFIRFRFRS